MLAEKLRVCGVGRNKVVGIFMERCLEYTVSYIAILKAGNEDRIRVPFFLSKIRGGIHYEESQVKI